MSAKKAELLTKIGKLYNELGEAYVELSALEDADAAKSGKRGDDDDSGDVSGRKGKAKVESASVKPPKAAGTKGKAKATTEDEVREAAQKLIKAKGRQAALDVLAEFDAEKIADLEESDYGKVKAKLEAAMADDDGDDDDSDDDL